MEVIPEDPGLKQLRSGSITHGSELSFRDFKDLFKLFRFVIFSIFAKRKHGKLSDDPVPQC